MPKYLAVWSDCPDSFKKKMWSRMSGWVAFCFNQTLNWFQSKCKLVQAYFLGKKLSRCLISFKLFNMVICSWYCLHYGHESHEWPKILNGKRLTCSQNQGNSDPLQPNQNLHWMMNWCLSYHINIILYLFKLFYFLLLVPPCISWICSARQCSCFDIDMYADVVYVLLRNVLILNCPGKLASNIEKACCSDKWDFQS
jgi:hypothetical protein